MAKTKKYVFSEEYDYYECVTESHSVDDPDTGKNMFYVHNLCECPEDAMVNRDLFDANDWLEAVNLGIKLGLEGYEKAELVERKTLEDVLEEALREAANLNRNGLYRVNGDDIKAIVEKFAPKLQLKED